MAITFKDFIDINLWRPNAPAFVNTGAGQSLISDLRNDISRHPRIILLRSATILDVYDPTTDEWLSLISPALTGTFGAGAIGVFHPSQGPRGTLAAGATTTKVILSTVLPSAVAINQLANRGDGIGFKIRIIGYASGKVEERTIVANTAGTAPSIWVDSAFTFTPAVADLYEILSGRAFLLCAGTIAAGIWKYYDVACNVMSGNLLTTNLPVIGTDSDMIALSELHVPNNREPGEGFVNGDGTSDGKNCIQATAADATTITGSGMPADLVADEYRNFQVRIVADVTAPTAVGQRRRISAHTAGATGVFTVPTWTVTPSAMAKFVVENDDDKILLITGANILVYNYNIAANTWDTTTWAAPVAGGAGVTVEQAFGTTRDVTNNHRHSFIYRIRGGATATIDVLDIAGAATGVWSNDIVYGKKGLTTFTTGNSGIYDPATLEGRFLHLDLNGTQRTARFDMRNRVLDAETYLRMTQGAAVVGRKMAFGLGFDGAVKIGFIYRLLHTLPNLYSLAIPR